MLRDVEVPSRLSSSTPGHSHWGHDVSSPPRTAFPTVRLPKHPVSREPNSDALPKTWPVKLYDGESDFVRQVGAADGKPGTIDPFLSATLI